MDTVLELRALTKHFPTHRAVNGVSLALQRGEFFSLLGPSGCGKTTTLRLIAGFETPTSGGILLNGRPVANLKPYERNVNTVFQNYALFPHLTVAENILFGLRVRRLGAAECDARLARVGDLLGLKTLLARKPSQLSGGQQQRVALGRAIIAQAPVCLMDEPLSNLDAQLRAEMRLEIRALQRKLGITMVYVTHDQVEAMSMADRVVLMRGGRIEQNGTPVDLYENPANTFVARFIGTPPMNLLQLEAGRGGAVIAGTEAPVVLDARFAAGTLGVRPEHMQLGFEDGVRAGVESVEYLGGDSLVGCRIGSQAVAVRVQGSVGLRRGDATWIRWVAGAQHYFDAAGLRGPVEAHEPAATLIA